MVKNYTKKNLFKKRGGTKSSEERKLVRNTLKNRKQNIKWVKEPEHNLERVVTVSQNDLGRTGIVAAQYDLGRADVAEAQYDLGRADITDVAEAQYDLGRADIAEAQYDLGRADIAEAQYDFGRADIAEVNTLPQIGPSIIYLPQESVLVKTKQNEKLNLNGRYIKLYITNKNIWIYLQIISETPTSFSVLRLQPDQYNERKFYLTDEKNKFHGLIKDGSLGKSRNIYLF
jgi:hypothetical protein